MHRQTTIKQQNQHHNHLSSQQQHPRSSTTKTTSKMTSLTIFSLLATLALISAVDSKPLNQNSVKFRRLPPKEFSAALGSSITIECEAAASPPPTLHWLKDGRRISQNDFDENQLEDLPQNIQVDEINRIALSSTRSRLYIDCADLDDEATYTCVAENAFSRVSSHTKLNLIRSALPAAVSEAGDLFASKAAAVSALEMVTNGGDSTSNGADNSAGKQQLVGAGAQKSLTAVPQCLSQKRRIGRQTEAAIGGSVQPVRIHMWTHNIIEIMKNDVILYCRSNIKKPVVASQSLLEADNSQTSSSSSEAAAAAAAVAKAPSNEETLTNVDLQLDGVVAAATKRPQIVWALPDDKLVTPEMREKYEILETGDLLIKDLRWADMGSYICTVTDDQGSSDSISTFVYPASSKASSSSKRSTGSHQQVSSSYRQY